jgi:methyl-accepting chemotaxis protein
VTITVAFAGFYSLGTRFDEVARRSERQALALELKFAVTDVNGWQTAYGYDAGRSRPEFERSAADTRRLLAQARREFTEPRERVLVARATAAFADFMRLDVQAFSALRSGRPEHTRQILLGPEIRNFQTMADAAGRLAAEQARAVVQARRQFETARRDARRQLVTVALGAGILIVLLLVTAQDVVRLALERPARPAR